MTNAPTKYIKDDALKASMRGSGIFWVCSYIHQKIIAARPRNLIVDVVTSTRASIAPISTTYSHSKARTVEVDGRLTHDRLNVMQINSK